MSEKKKSLFPFYVVCVIFSIVIIALMTILVVKNTTLNKRLVEANVIIQSKDNVISSQKGNYNYKEDCETDADLLLMKHMEIYIKRRYTKTPTIIAKDISKKIIFFSKKYELPPELILGMIEVESMFNPLLESRKGAKGLMQVMPEWAPKLGLKNVNDLHEIDIGIESGIKVFLIHLEEAKGNISGGLYRYVNKDHSYVERVYSSVGRFVTYRSTLENPENKENINKEKDKNDNPN